VRSSSDHFETLQLAIEGLQFSSRPGCRRGLQAERSAGLELETSVCWTASVSDSARRQSVCSWSAAKQGAHDPIVVFEVGRQPSLWAGYRNPELLAGAESRGSQGGSRREMILSIQRFAAPLLPCHCLRLALFLVPLETIGEQAARTPG